VRLSNKMRASFVLYIFLSMAWLWSPVHAQITESTSTERIVPRGPLVEELSQDIASDSLSHEEQNPEKSKAAHDTFQGVPYRKESVIPPETLTRVLVVIVFSMLLVFAVVYLLKKYLITRNLLGRDEHRMQLIETRRLSQRSNLFMVRIDDKTMVLAQCGERLIALDPAKSFDVPAEDNNDEI
jgi:flagellar biogenesis protein FliO